MSNQLTFDSIPAAISQILDRVSNIEKQLTTQLESSPAPDRWMSLEELCAYLPGNPAKATIYGKVHRREIPHQKSGKRLSFLQSEIDAWLKSQSRVSGQPEILDGYDFLKNKGHRK